MPVLQSPEKKVMVGPAATASTGGVTDRCTGGGGGPAGIGAAAGAAMTGAETILLKDTDSWEEMRPRPW
jgi:NADPH-dependent 2,4-dienoyl-CoA reductase/sulfur reductase-like enzyme